MVRGRHCLSTCLHLWQGPPRGRWKSAEDPGRLDDAADTRPADAHNDTLRMANQHIAHRVADHEGAVVVAVLTPPPGPREVAGVGQMLVHMIGPEVVVAERLASVCEVLLGLFNTEADRLGTLIRTKLGEANIDELYAASSIPGQKFTVAEEDPEESGEPDEDTSG